MEKVVIGVLVVAAVLGAVLLIPNNSNANVIIQDVLYNESKMILEINGHSEMVYNLSLHIFLKNEGDKGNYKIVVTEKNQTKPLNLASASIEKNKATVRFVQIIPGTFRIVVLSEQQGKWVETGVWEEIIVPEIAH